MSVPWERSPVSKLQKSRLGRGLSSLISVSSTPVEVEIPALPGPAVKPLDLGTESDAGALAAPRAIAPPKMQNEPTVAPTVVPPPQLGTPVELAIWSIQPNPHQ